MILRCARAHHFAEHLFSKELIMRFGCLLTGLVDSYWAQWLFE